MAGRIAPWSSQQELSTPMFSRKYKVRRNDTTATTDLGSTLSAPERGGVGHAVRQLSVPRRFPMFTGNTFQPRRRVNNEHLDNPIRRSADRLAGRFYGIPRSGRNDSLLLVFAVISLILHFVLGPRAA